MPHKENGFYKNKWRTDATRWNQLRYYNEVRENKLIEEDGLSNLKFTIHGIDEINENISIVNIGI